MEYNRKLLLQLWKKNSILLCGWAHACNWSLFWQKEFCGQFEGLNVLLVEFLQFFCDFTLLALS